jgi:DNA repair protein RadC
MAEVDQVPYRLMIREMSPEERPRERMRNVGADALSNSELLAILMNTGMKGEPVTMMAQRLLHEHGGLPGLMRMDFVEMARVKGVGESKAAKVKAAFELGKRLAVLSDDGRMRIESPEDVVQLLGIEMASLEQEQLRVVLLDTKNQVLSVRMVYQGSVNSASIRTSEVFRDAVRHNAVGIVLVHNHPSGDPTPSSADVLVTLELVKAGELLQINVIDHLVIGQGRHVSMKRLGLGFQK